jgi:hypothetical protein
MSDSARGLILWILAAVGVLFVYAGIRNIAPQSLLGSFVNPSTPRTPIESHTATGAAPTSGNTSTNANGASHTTGDTTPLGAVMSA